MAHLSCDFDNVKNSVFIHLIYDTASRIRVRCRYVWTL